VDVVFENRSSPVNNRIDSSVAHLSYNRAIVVYEWLKLLDVAIDFIVSNSCHFSSPFELAISLPIPYDIFRVREKFREKLAAPEKITMTLIYGKKKPPHFCGGFV
jgi:hypothetical protein